MESTIKWHTGEPKEEDTYIVTYENGEVDFDVFMSDNGWTGILKVIAWCKMSDIKPYKEREEQEERIEEMADNYMRGRAMVLCFNPLTLEDIKEAYLCGAENMKRLMEEEEDCGWEF